MENYFTKLAAINCNDHTEKKNGLTYLSWAWAWEILKEQHPDASYTIYTNPDLGGMPYFTDGKTCMVKTGVTVNGIEHIEMLPVMDFRNQSVPFEKVTSMDINKAVQRSLTKAISRHGLGIYIYAGEDLPDAEDDAKREAVYKEREATKAAGVDEGSIIDAMSELAAVKDKAGYLACYNRWNGYFGTGGKWANEAYILKQTNTRQRLMEK